jgi:NitT/TauT family transport system ATP-binding protein
MHASVALAVGPSKLVIDRVSKWYDTPRGRTHALNEITLSVAEGEFVCLVGPSGCGKSTLLDVIAGLSRPDEGRVYADGTQVSGPGRNRLVMFQESAHRTRQRDVRTQADAGSQQS